MAIYVSVVVPLWLGQGSAAHWAVHLDFHPPQQAGGVEKVAAGGQLVGGGVGGWGGGVVGGGTSCSVAAEF